MVAFRYPTVNRKIWSMVRRCSFWKYWPPLCSKYVDKRSLTHPGSEHQPSVNKFRSCILGNQSGHSLQIVITEVLASFIGNSRSDMLPAPSWKWALYEHQRLKVSQLGWSKWRKIANLSYGGIGSFSSQLSKRRSHDSLLDSNNWFHVQWCNKEFMTVLA